VEARLSDELSGRKEKKVRIVDHRHCRICGKAIPPNQEFCSEDCRSVSERMEARQKRMRNILILMYVVVFIILFAMIALRGALG